MGGKDILKKQLIACEYDNVLSLFFWLTAIL